MTIRIRIWSERRNGQSGQEKHQVCVAGIAKYMASEARRDISWYNSVAYTRRQLSHFKHCNSAANCERVMPARLPSACVVTVIGWRSPTTNHLRTLAVMSYTAFIILTFTHQLYHHYKAISHKCLDVSLPNFLWIFNTFVPISCKFYEILLT